MTGTTAQRGRDEGPPPPLPGDFAALYEQHLTFVWNNCRRLGVQPAQLDDAVQDVFLAVYRRLPEFRGEASFKTWLFHFVLRVSATYRRAGRATQRRLDAQAAEPSRPVATPDSAVEGRQAAEVMYRVLDALTEERRELFVLVELEELSVADAARVLELNQNTAHSRLRDARRDFAQAVERERAKEAWRTR
ncbi:MAG: sigma-70 family RNA polymerase sigma factor [Myxococcaceae bacterium]|nr:sigma-70 family RNA polymerase sigma factor [Myxococcaceae bacterium]